MKNSNFRIVSLLCAVALLLPVVIPCLGTTAYGAGIANHTHQYGNYEYQGDYKVNTLDFTAKDLLDKYVTLPVQPTSASDLIARAGNDVLASFGANDFSLPFGATYGDTVVSDEGALGGYAAKLSYADRVAGGGDAGLTGAMIITEKLELLGMSFVPSTYEGLLVKAITTAELQENSGDGYVLYKADNVKPMAEAKESGNILQMFSCTGFQVNLDAYKEELNGKTVDVYMSMKVTGNVTSTGSDSPAYYIDSIVITESTALEKVDSDVLYSFGASAFTFSNGESTGTVVEDSDSSIGTAVKRVFTSTPTLEFHAYGGNTYTGSDFGKITDLKAGQGYQLHRFSVTNANFTGATMLYMFDDWQLQSDTIRAALIACNGMNIDVYVSLKVSDDALTFYIDSVIITKANTVTEVVNYKPIDYGTMVGTCIYGCGATDTKPASDRHVQIFDANSFTLQYASTNGDKVVADTDSVMGSAVMYASYPRRSEDTQHLIMGEGKFLDIGTDKATVARLHAEDLIADGNYHIYKFSFSSLDLGTSPSLIYVLNDWGMQNPSLLTALKAYQGQAVDILLSMKVTGNPDGTGTNSLMETNWPVYYIDKIMISEPCSVGYYSGTTPNRTCSKCGLTEYASVLKQQLTLNSIFKVSFYAQTSLVGTLKADGNALTAAGTKTIDGVSYTEYTLDVLAQDMLKEIDVTLYNAGGSAVAAQPFALEDYLDKVVAGDMDSKTLADATIDYCQHAAYVKYNTGTPNALVAIPDEKLDSFTMSKAEGSAADILFNAYLDEACDLQILLPVSAYKDKGSYEVSVAGGETKTISQLDTKTINGTQYYVYRKAGIVAQNYDEAYAFTVKNGQTQVYGNTVSVLAYIHACLDGNKGTSAERDLMTAMYHYYMAAEDYLTKH